jgi:hypothetical protein
MKVGFVLLSPAQQPIPSTRVAVLNILPLLKAAGVDARIVFEPPQATETPLLTLSAATLRDQGYDVICFQKVCSPSVLALAHDLRAVGVKTVFVVCDLVEPQMCAATDATLVISHHLKSLYPAALQERVHVVHDGIERPEVVKTDQRADRGSAAQPLRAVLVSSGYVASLPMIGLPPPWLQVNVVAAYPPPAGRWQTWRDLQWRIRQQQGLAARWHSGRFLTHPRVRRVAWGPERVYHELLAADIGILPIDTPGAGQPGHERQAWAVKSENRLTLKMSVGLPVVATPIPSYLPVIEPGVNGCFARSTAEWRDRLEQLRDPGLRRRLGQAARASVAERYSVALQAQRFLAVLGGLPA